MVRGLTLTACNGISFQQFGACAQIDSVRNSADKNVIRESTITNIKASG